MEFSRRGFLNLLGIGGVGLAAGPVSLFGSDEVPGLIMPDRSLVSGHYVVKPKGFIERVPADDPAHERNARLWSRSPWGSNGDARVVARLTRNREPAKPILVRNGSFLAKPLLYFDEETTVQDAHAAFYVASHELRERFTAFTRETLSQVDKELRPMATLVTIVDAPIHAQPTGAGRPCYDPDPNILDDRTVGPLSQRDERGFDLVASFRQFVVLGAQRSEVDAFEQYSTTGEYPVDVPRDVELGMLLKLDREILAAGAWETRRVANLLSRFSTSRRSAIHVG